MKRFILLLLLFVTYANSLSAQNSYTKLDVKGGHNAIFGPFAAISAEAGYEAQKYFAVFGGAQYNTIGSVAAELRPRYFHDFNFGRLSGEALLGATYQSHMYNFIMGCGASLDTRYIWANLGYYYRSIRVDGESICEPFNIYYELGIRCIPKCKQWDLNLIITNNRHFEIERHYQPSFAIDTWWHANDKFGLEFGVSYKPAGMFSISSEFYQLYANIGVCYKW